MKLFFSIFTDFSAHKLFPVKIYFAQIILLKKKKKKMLAKFHFGKLQS